MEYLDKFSPDIITMFLNKNIKQRINDELFKNLSKVQRYSYKGIVLLVDIDGNKLSGQNPPNTIICRLLEVDGGLEDKTIMGMANRIIYPGSTSPIRTGEVVNVIYNDESMTIGYWLPYSTGKENFLANNTSDKDYKVKSNLLMDTQNSPYKNMVIDEKKVDELMGDQDIRDMLNINDDDKGRAKIKEYLMGDDVCLIESAPPLKRRVGDNVVEGYNNAIIILTADRKNEIGSGYFKKGDAGAIYNITGRRTADLDLINDKTVIYQSSKCDPDGNFGLPQGEHDVLEQSAIGLQSANIRLLFDFLRIFSKTLKCSIEITPDDKIILVQGDTKLEFKDNTISLKRGEAKIVINEAGNIDFESYESITINGKNAFVKYNEMMGLFNNHTHLTPMGISDAPLNKMGDGESTLT